jgi:hypothetical protein
MRGHASSFWPTPNAPNGGRALASEWIEKKGKTPKGKRQVGLEATTKNWQTPNASTREGYNKSASAGAAIREHLTSEAKNWSTPYGVTRNHGPNGNEHST